MPATRSSPRFAVSLAAGFGGLFFQALATHQAAATDEFHKLRTNKTDFKHFDLGAHAPPRSGRTPFPLARFVAAPDIGLPMEIDPKAGEHMYCNTQVYNLGGFHAPTGPGTPGGGFDSEENYYFPWTSNFCEKRGRHPNNKVCGTQYTEHMGQDCRPPKPMAREYWVTAVDDGIAGDIGAAHSIAIKNDRFRWVYLHMKDRQVRPGQQVRKGQRLGKVSNVMQGGTTIHLHIELKFNDKGQYRQLDPLPSLIAAYHRALGNAVPVNEDGTLAYDPRFEMRGPAAASASLCGAENRPSIGAETQFTFSALWCHNGSLMGLVEDGAARKFVYYKPRNDDLVLSVKGDPVLVEAGVSDAKWSGKARHYSGRCGNRQFDVAGAASADGKSLQISGKRDSFTGKTCDDVSKVTENLAFTYVGSYPPPSVETGPAPSPQAPATAPAPVAQTPSAPLPGTGSEEKPK